MNIKDEKCVFVPSLICLDMCNLERQVKELEAAGIKMLHVDILDGHFSPSMPLGLETVRQLRSKTNLNFDAHLMVTEPDYFIEELLNIGVQQLVFHLETAAHTDELLNKIRASGVRTGVALKPSTPLSALDYILEKCDTVLLMLINPGYASSVSESQVIYAERKIRDLREIIRKRNLAVKIEVDGRISLDNIENFGNGDVDIFVIGSTCINRKNIGQSMEKLNQLRKKIIQVH
jgi:ribulose-phosphate 3-epimerase